MYDEDFLKVSPSEVFPDDINYVKGVSTILDGIFFGGYRSLDVAPYTENSDNIYIVSPESITKIENIGPLTDSNNNAIGVQMDSLLFLFTYGSQIYVYSY